MPEKSEFALALADPAFRKDFCDLYNTVGVIRDKVTQDDPKATIGLTNWNSFLAIDVQSAQLSIREVIRLTGQERMDFEERTSMPLLVTASDSV